MERNFDFGALLQNHEKKHKIRPTQFVSVAGGIQRRLESNIKTRKSNRLTVFDSLRSLERCNTPKKQKSAQTKLEHRRMQLEKFKEEKEKKKKQAAAQKRKPFVTGIAHAPLKYEPPPPPPKAMPSTSGRVTRSQSAKNNTKPKPVQATVTHSKTQSFAPKNASFRPPEMKNMIQLPILGAQPRNTKSYVIKFEPVMPDAPQAYTKLVKSETLKVSETKSDVKSKKHVHIETRITRRHVKVSNSSSNQTQRSTVKKLSPVSEKPLERIKAPQKTIQTNKTSTPKNPIPKSESSSEERLRSPKSPGDVPMTPEQIVEQAKNISPCVTLSRGKDNARREMKKKLEEGLLDEDISNSDNVEHFRRQLHSEIKRMTEMCDTWEKISEDVVLPEAVHEAVLGAVGQARLLMSKKLQQFASLLATCECPEPGQRLVTPADLHGFWDMVFMQVENVDMRFKKLEDMRARNWAEDVRPAPRTRPVSRAPPARPAPRAPAASSRIRDMIAAARKAKKQESQAQDAPPLADPAEPMMESDKTFEGGFFCVRSPVRLSAPSTPSHHRPSLLKAVLSSEAKKSVSKNRASLAMLRVSLIGKNLENDSDFAESRVLLTPLDVNATPGRSILKSQNEPSTRKSSSRKSVKVLFNEAADKDTTINGTQDIFDIKEVTVDTGENNKGYKKEESEKENIKKKKKKKKDSTKKSLAVENTVEDHSPVMTRSRRKSMPTPTIHAAKEMVGDATPKRSARKKKQHVDQ